MSGEVYMVRFPGRYRKADFDKMRERFMEVNGDVLGENVVFVDSGVEDVLQLRTQDVGRLVEVLAPIAGMSVERLEE